MVFIPKEQTDNSGYIIKLKCNVMINKIVEYLKKYNLQDKTIIVGFSGGYDSMCLLDILSKVKDIPEFFDLNVIAAHFNHNWRGEESLKEQEVCRLFAASRGMEFYTKTAPSTLKKTENDARIARYEFFEEAYEEFDADAVFTAHNKDDNAETVLYRVIKGTGINGLKGISEKRKYFYRPFLKTYRSEILKYCNDNNLTPNEDSSNNNIVYQRNYLRHNIIPALQKINPEVQDALNILAENANNDNEIIEEYLSSIRGNVFNEDRIVTEEYKKLSMPVKKRFVYEYIQNLGLDYDYRKINDIIDFIESNSDKRNGSTLSLATAMWLYADSKVVEPIPRKKQSKDDNFAPIEIYKEGVYKYANKIFTIKKYDEGQLFIFPESTANFAYVDLSETRFPLVLRTRHDGDIITPFGMKGTMKLKKYMNGKGVSKHRRDDIPLLCNNDEVLWVAGVGLNDKIGVKDKPTHVIEVTSEQQPENKE